MGIRCSAKAIIVDNGKVLVNRCRDEETGEIYYDLPGGGQHPFETLEEAVVREVREETGYTVEVCRFGALTEEIYEDAELREKYPEYCHRILHIFIAKLTEEKRQQVTETDLGQESSEWVSLGEADELSFRPETLNGKVSRIVNGNGACFLGSQRWE